MRFEGSRRRFLQSAAASSSMIMLHRSGLSATPLHAEAPLEEFTYEQVSVRGPNQVAQRDNVSEILMGLDEDSLLKPFREMSDQSAPGTSLGGRYAWKPDYNYHHDDVGLAPGATFGQWKSSLSRLYASSRFGGPPGRTDMAARVVRLHTMLADSLTSGSLRRPGLPDTPTTNLSADSWTPIVWLKMAQPSISWRRPPPRLFLFCLDMRSTVTCSGRLVRISRRCGMRTTRCRRICISSPHWEQIPGIVAWRRSISSIRPSSSRCRVVSMCWGTIRSTSTACQTKWQPNQDRIST